MSCSLRMSKTIFSAIHGSYLYNRRVLIIIVIQVDKVFRAVQYMNGRQDIQLFQQMLLDDITIVEENPVIAEGFVKEFAHYTFRKEPVLYIAFIISEALAKFSQKLAPVTAKGTLVRLVLYLSREATARQRGYRKGYGDYPWVCQERP